MYKKSFIFLTLFAIFLQGHNPATHMYIGSRTFNVWRNFDPEFYDSLSSSSDYGRMTRKFYYIGLTMPDMFDADVQDGIDNLITTLYENREDWWLIVNTYGTMGAFYITDATYSQVQTRIDFNGAYPNGNLDKLREMMEYARNKSDWGPLDKALIYGTYMHVVHDLYAHMVLQPARFGYGRSIDADSAESFGLLNYPESYYELFTSTWMPNEVDSLDFIKDVFIGKNLYGGVTTANAPAEFVYFFNNRTGQYVKGWQNIDSIPQVANFVEAAQTVGYGTSSLTYKRLQAYMHGWGIVLFMAYGYTSGAYDNIGGMPIHPDWDFGKVKDFWKDIIDNNTYTTPPLQILNDFLNVIHINVKKWLIGRKIGQQTVPSSVGMIVLPANLGELAKRSYSWPYFYETTAGLDTFWACVKEEDKTPEATHNYYIWRRVLEFYENHSSVKTPNIRNSYREELKYVLALQPRYKAMIDGSDNLDYKMYNSAINDSMSIYQFSRKSGLLGGMYPINDPTYEFFDQPGVFDMHFEQNQKVIYTTTPVSSIENLYPIELKYDVMPFGPTRIYIRGKKEDGTWDRLVWADLTSADAYKHISSTLSLDPTDAINQGYRELSFEVMTPAKDNPAIWNTMLLSDYRDAYNSTPAISNNDLYKAWFKNGDPVRDEAENPMDNPKLYWPYTLPMVLLNKLNTPAVHPAQGVLPSISILLKWVSGLDI